MNKPSIGQLGAITAMAFHSAGHLLTVVNTEGVVSVWDPVSGEVRGEKRIGRPCAITAIATRTDGFLLAGKETGGAVTLLTPPYGFLVGDPHRSE
jgi:hypothetical protein